MTGDILRNYDELNEDEKEFLDVLREMKLMCEHARFKYHRLQITNLINAYENLKHLREEIQANYFSIYDELKNDNLINGEIDADIWGLNREHESETWDSELRLMNEIKTNLDIAIKMIESGEAEQSIIDEENSIS